MKDAFQSVGFVLRLPLFLLGVAVYSGICFPFCLFIVLCMSLRHPFALLGHLINGDRRSFDRERQGFAREADKFLTGGYRGLYEWLLRGGDPRL